MIREHWREPRFWRWFWQNRAPLGAKLAVGLVVAAAFLLGGFFAADRLSGASAGVTALTYQTTVEEPVTVREHGKTIVRRVSVVRRVVLQPQTAFETRYDTRVVTTPGGVRLVPQRVVKYVPVIRRRVITVNGKTQTITQTKLVPVTTVRTQTLTNVVTNQQTVVDQNTVTVVNNRSVTVPVTVTESHTETVVVTETQPAETVTLPVTVTDTLPLPVTVTVPVP
jgi:hypothetical protein